ncbi:MAG: hypothetical protein GY765_35980 [bacterium]|nr:hypothetical protein [bacterium]
MPPFSLGAEAAKTIFAEAAEIRITLNTLFKVARALLLGQYGGNDDVVFGTVVSGRPPEIEGVTGIAFYWNKR